MTPDLLGCRDGRPLVIGPDRATDGEPARERKSRDGRPAHERLPSPAPAGRSAGGEGRVDDAAASALRFDSFPTITKRPRTATIAIAVAASAPAMATPSTIR